MKNFRTILLVVLVATLAKPYTVKAQEEEEKESPFSVGADLVSSYVWRGVKYGGPSLQPYVEFGVGGFAIGAWGSFDFTYMDLAVNEADLYAGYGFNFGLYVGVTDYYYQGSPYFKYDSDSASHAIEGNLAYEIGGFSISANYIFNDARNGAGSQGGDMYFEAGYAFKNFEVFVGAGDGWHTTDGDFGLVNIGIGASKEIKITEKYSLPISGQVILNPEAEQFHVVAAISF
jgi:uncharacterized protein (TIGR02001 family)